MYSKSYMIKMIFIIGSIGSFISATAMFPQTIQIYKTKDVDSFSFSYLLFRMLGLTMVSLQSFYLGIYNVGFLTGWLVLNYGYYLMVKLSHPNSNLNN